jgi:hypothetical protein
MEKIIWTDRVRNEVESRRGTSYEQYEEERLTELVTWCVRTAFLNTLLKERYVEG